MHFLFVRDSQSDALGERRHAGGHGESAPSPISGVITLQIHKFVAGTIFNASAIGRNDPSGSKLNSGTAPGDAAH